MAKHARRKARQTKKNNPLLWGIIALLILGVSAVALTTRGGAETAAYPREISVEQAAAERDSGAFILDVRQPEEWNEFHIPGSTLIPLGELAARVDELPRDREIVVVCRSGNRSAQGRDILLDAGFTQVTSMAGGVTQWRAAGYPTVSGP
ncbi:MAG: rhodanese-like domain-containing protein [Anaerolineales bacterium]